MSFNILGHHLIIICFNIVAKVIINLLVVNFQMNTSPSKVRKNLFSSIISLITKITSHRSISLTVSPNPINLNFLGNILKLKYSQSTTLLQPSFKIGPDLDNFLPVIPVKFKKLLTCNSTLK